MTFKSDSSNYTQFKVVPLCVKGIPTGDVPICKKRVMQRSWEKALGICKILYSTFSISN